MIFDKERFEINASSFRKQNSTKIGTLSEKRLHLVLKKYFCDDEAKHEVKLGPYFLDIFNIKNFPLLLIPVIILTRELSFNSKSWFKYLVLKNISILLFCVNTHFSLPKLLQILLISSSKKYYIYFKLLISDEYLVTDDSTDQELDFL